MATCGSLGILFVRLVNWKVFNVMGINVNWQKSGSLPRVARKF